MAWVIKYVGKYVYVCFSNLLLSQLVAKPVVKEHNELQTHASCCTQSTDEFIKMNMSHASLTDSFT